MENKKLYICGSEFGQANYKKTYTSVEKLKLDNLSWNELGIYEIKVLKTNCIEEPSLFNVDIDDQVNIEEDSESEITQNSVNTFFGKISQVFKRTKETDWTDVNGNKEFKWSGKCDACREQKTNLTVIHSAALSGVTICRECRMGTLRD
tara:strand:- start:811 stop:1257 length:447 start_codon:yes stop_codon:yes gene_type:complete